MGDRQKEGEEEEIQGERRTDRGREGGREGGKVLEAREIKREKERGLGRMAREGKQTE